MNPHSQHCFTFSTRTDVSKNFTQWFLLLQDWHCDEAEAGWRPVRRRVRGHLEATQRHHCCQNSQGELSHMLGCGQKEEKRTWQRLIDLDRIYRSQYGSMCISWLKLEGGMSGVCICTCVRVEEHFTLWTRQSINEFVEKPAEIWIISTG